jgi:hypothetical protein
VRNDRNLHSQNYSSQLIPLNRGVDSTTQNQTTIIHPISTQQQFYNPLSRVVVQTRNPNFQTRGNSVETVKLLSSGIKQSRVYNSPVQRENIS